jgi:chromosome partitioning protein
MRIVSMMNSKGGVGKTTLTANLGVGLALRGYRVLLIDFDPQTSLTLSFYPEDVWNVELSQNRTIKTWFDAHLTNRRAVPPLHDLVATPPIIAARLAGTRGRLDLVASHLHLGDLDARLAAELGRASAARTAARHLWLHRLLADALEDDNIVDAYDFVLIDCPPDFGYMTRIALVASNRTLIPVKADDLSTHGVSHLLGNLEDLRGRYQGFADGGPPIDPRVIGVVVTMVELYAGRAIKGQRSAVDHLKADIPTVTVFDGSVRNSPNSIIRAVRSSTPVILAESADSAPIVDDLSAVTDEFLRRVESE